MLKQLIQRLLDSRTTPSEASHSSYPDDGTVTQFSPSATSVSSWTKVVDSTIAPSDGYVIVRGKATGESYVQITAGDNPPHMERSTFAKTTLNQYPILNLPIAKGKTFKVFAENTTEITVGLIKAIGGGYNHLVRRTLSCLRPSFNYLPRSFCKASLSGLVTKQCQTIQQRGLSTPLKAHRANTLLRVTDTSLFTLVAMNGRKSGMETEVSLSPQRVLPTSAFKCLSLKAPKLGTSFRTPWPTELKKRPLSLFQQSERNALTGGELC